MLSLLICDGYCLMEITFKSDELQRICTEKAYMSRKLGPKSAKKLRARLADISAASHVAELHAGRPHALKHDRIGKFAVSLDGGTRLVFESANIPIPITNDGGIARNQVTKIRIVEIGDYHD